MDIDVLNQNNMPNDVSETTNPKKTTSIEPNPVTPNQNEVAKQVVQRKLCGCLLCGRKLIAFPRHLREYHKFSDHAAKKYGNKYKVTGAALKDLSVCSVKRYKCQVNGCDAIVNRIDRHLLGKKHNFEVGNSDYVKYKHLAQCHIVPGTIQNTQIDSDTDSSLFLESSDNDDDDHDTNSECFDDSDDCNLVENDLDIGNELGETGKVILDDLEEYCDRLRNFVGGYKSEGEVRQIRQHVIHMLYHFGTDFKAETLCDNMIKVEKDFISKKLETLQASTVKNYLIDFKRFISWAKTWYKQWLTWHVADRIETLVTSWNKSLAILIARRSSEKKLEHQRCALKEEDFMAYFKGEKAIKANKIFSASVNDDDQSHIDTKDHTTARDFLLMLLTVSNVSRAGPLVNMTKNDVKNATYDEEMNSYVISVSYHKTQRTYGAAQLVLDRDGFAYLVTYIYKIRSCIPGISGVDQVFITSKGRPINQSELANILSKEMIDAVGRENRTTCTIIRKSVVSILLKGDLGSKNEADLASLMKHSLRMQKQIYDVRNSNTNMARMSGLVLKMLFKQPLTQKDLERPGSIMQKKRKIETETSSKKPLLISMPDEDNNKLIVNTQSTEGSKSKSNEDSISIKSPIVQLEIMDVDKMNLRSQKVSDNSRKSNGKQKWPIHLCERLAQVFSSYVNKKYITSNDVKTVLKQKPDLMREITKFTDKKTINENVKKVYDKVRSFYNKK